MDKNELIKEKNKRLSECLCEIAARDFWEYCKLMAPEFYLDNRTYLKELCRDLQDFYQGNLLKSDNTPYKKIMIQMPPRHGKTRTLVLFSSWIFGLDPGYKILAAAFDDDLAQDFSRYTRDTISQEANDEEHETVYRDIFPKTKVKFGQASYKKWALVGSHFSYKGCGIGGSVTGKGGDMLLLDDPVKSAEDAYNDASMDKKWMWYTSTWLSRGEAIPLEIVTNTPWCKNDIGGRLLEMEPEEWYLISRPAMDEETGEMLCKEILPEKKYFEYEKKVDPLIFNANYKMSRIDKAGLMYQEFTTYDELPDFEGTYKHDGRIMITDTAGKGSDYLCSLYGYATGEYFYIFDVDYTQEDIDITEGEAARKIVKHKINTADIESNSAGHSWAYHVEQKCKDVYKWFGTTFLEKNQSKNKEARIFTHHREVNRRLILPFDWRQRWPKFYDAVTTFSKTGKNKNDDAPDTITRVVEYLNSNVSGIVKANYAKRK